MTTETNGLRIIRLEAENFKKLRAVEVTPTGDVVIVSGKNGAGKSSLLDSIYAALAGAKSLPRVPVRRGQERAFVKVSLGRDRVQLVVTREFTAGGSVLRVESPDGARFPSPQTMLDALLGELTFDPLAFAQAEPRGQFEALRGIVKLDVDLDHLDMLSRSDFDKRTEINREVKSTKAQADAVKVSGEEYAPLIDTAELKDRMGKASATNVEIEKRRGKREAAAIEIENLRRRAGDDRTEAQSLRARADEMDRDAKLMEDQANDTAGKLAAAPPHPEPVDVEAIRTDLDRAERHNLTVTQETERRERKASLLAGVARLEGQSRELTEAMEARAKAKTEAIARAPMPVDGLGFGEGLVTFGGVPFDQASSAEQLRVSVAIAMATNPKLRVIRIKEGSLLDSDNVALIAAMAQERGYQVWLESVGTGGKVGIEIEDGSVVAVDGEPVGAKAGE